MAILNTVAQFGKYRLRTRLASSRACEVWLAELEGATAGSPPLVLKKLHREFAQQSGTLERFERRAKMAQALSQENVNAVIDVVRSHDDCAICIEYVDGKTLRQLISAVGAAGNALPIWFAVHVARCVCLALEHAHSLLDAEGHLRPLIHQNLVPENVFLTYNGEIKVSDFGVSGIALERDDDFAPVVSMRTQIGGPESRKHHEPVAAIRGDLDGVGRILYELLTGALPAMPDGSPIDFVPPSHHAPWVNAEVDQLLRRILSPSYPNRVQSAADVRRVLDEYLTQRRHDVSATHLAGLVTVLFSNECRDSSPPTMRFDEGAIQLAHLRSRRTTPPENLAHTAFEHSAPTRPGLVMPVSGQVMRPTMPSPAADDSAEHAPATRVSPSSSDPRSSNAQLDASQKRNPFHHDWDLALKHAREQSQGVTRSSGTFPTPRPEPPPQPVDPAVQAVIEFERGLELRQRGDFEAALSAWEKALELDPQHRVCRANLNLLKKKLNLS